LTACLAVLGRYAPNLEFLSVLLGDEPVLEPHVAYYQRLLAKDQDEAADLVEEFRQNHPAEEVYDRLLVPALTLAKENRERGEFTREDEQFILDVSREILDDLVWRKQIVTSTENQEPEDRAENQVLVFGCPARDEIDEIALSMFGQLANANKCRFEVISYKKLTAEVIIQVEQCQPKAICIASLPPKGLAHTRYLCKRLRSQFPELKILVGCWGLEENINRTQERLIAAGADQVGATLLQTRGQLIPIIQLHSHIKQTADKAKATVSAS
jgi:hypothetical protein